MNSMNLCRCSTKEPQLVAFQFKIIQNIVNCASNLKRNWEFVTLMFILIAIGEIQTLKILWFHASVDCQTTLLWLQSINTAIKVLFIQNVCGDKFLFGLQDKADNMMCIMIKKYICDIRGQKKAFFIETFLKNYLIIVADKILEMVKL